MVSLLLQIGHRRRSGRHADFSVRWTVPDDARQVLGMDLNYSESLQWNVTDITQQSVPASAGIAVRPFFVANVLA
jgi:hypothetical protein